MATHSSTLAWKIPWMGEPGRPWGPRVYGVAKSPKVQRDFTFTLELVFDSVSFHDIQLYFSSVQFSHSVVSDPLPPHESQHARPPCLSKTPGVYSNTCPSSWWCHWAISSSAVPFFSCPQFLPASGSFPTSQLFAWMCILVHPLSARPKYWSFSFNISPSNEHPGLIFRMDWLDLLAVQGTLKSLLQHHSSNLNYSYWLNTAPRTLHCPPPPHTHTHTHTQIPSRRLISASWYLGPLLGLVGRAAIWNQEYVGCWAGRREGGLSGEAEASHVRGFPVWLGRPPAESLGSCSAHSTDPTQPQPSQAEAVGPSAAAIT